MRPILAAIVFVLASHFSWAQASFDLRLVEKSDANTNSGTLTMTVQIRANASSSPSSFEVGTSTILIDYNTTAITYSSITAVNFDGFTAPGTFYTGMTATDNSGKLSVNIILSSGAGTGQPTVTTSWTDVCDLDFTINNSTLTENFFFYDNSTPGSKSEIFDDDLSTQLTPVKLIGFTNTDNNEIYWDGDAWYNGSGSDSAPGSGDGSNDVIVLGADAVLSDQVVVDDINIENGSLTIRPTASVTAPSITANGTITTNGNDFILESNANGYSQIIGTTSGDVTYQMYISQAGWHNVSSPIASMTLADLEDDITINYSGNLSGVSAFQWDAASGDWTEASANTDNFTGGWNIYIDKNFVPGGGGVNSDGNLPVIIDVTGTPNSGTQNATLGYAASPAWSGFEGANGTANDGWNLIANPYPSNLDWTEVGKGISGDVNAYFYIWNPASNEYVYNDLGGNGNAASTNIAPMQAIWVKLDAPGETSTTAFDFNDADRTVSSPASFLKTVSEVLKLSATSNSSGLGDQTSILRDAGFSLGYESNGDAFKRTSAGGKPSFYVISSDSMLLAVNRIDESFNGDTIMLGFEGSYSETYTVSIAENNFPSDFKIELHDLKTGAIIDMTSASHSFMNDTAFSEHRFNLYAVSKTIGIEEPGDGGAGGQTAFGVVTRGESIIVDLSSSQLPPEVDIDVVDISGRIIYEKSGIDSNGEFEFRFDTGLNQAYIYVVRVKNPETGEMWTEKIFY